MGQVIPTFEKCNQLDDDCDGAIEPQPCEDCQPGTGTCNGQVGHGCKDDGLGYIDEICDPLTGTSCNPNSGRCDGACGLKALGASYIGCDYYPTVTANLVATNFHFAVAVSNTTNQAATVTASKGAAILSTVNVAANSVAVIQLPWELTLKGPSSSSVVPFPASVKVVDGAYRLRSNQPVTVYQFNPIEYAIGNLLLLERRLDPPARQRVDGEISRRSAPSLRGRLRLLRGHRQRGRDHGDRRPRPRQRQVKSGGAGIYATGNGTIVLDRATSPRSSRTARPWPTTRTTSQAPSSSRTSPCRSSAATPASTSRTRPATAITSRRAPSPSRRSPTPTS